MQYFVSKVTSFTTDFGVEIHLVELPDCLEAFMRWIDGTDLAECAPWVRHGVRLFDNALRIYGWGHAWSNVVKRVVQTHPRWPEMLEQLRTMCRFFRNHTWREWLIRSLQHRMPNVGKLLKSWTATLAKWRYETLFVVMSALRPVRNLCEHNIHAELFANAQDKELVQQVLQCCRDKRLWAFVEVVSKIIVEPMEGARRWGLVCFCCEDKRRAGQKHVRCPRDSRKLRQAWQFVQSQKSEFSNAHRQLRLEDCEGSLELFGAVKSMLLTAVTTLETRFKYLRLVPWALSNADTVEGAQECLNQIRARPIHEHDVVTRRFVATLSADLEARAAGNACTPALEQAVKVLNTAPLDESAGEAYHRDTHHEQQRAPASTSAALKAATRIKEL